MAIDTDDFDYVSPPLEMTGDRYVMISREQNDRLRAVNAELLAALRGLLAHAEYYGTRTETPMPAIAAARAAIAKASEVTP